MLSESAAMMLACPSDSEYNEKRTPETGPIAINPVYNFLQTRPVLPRLTCQFKNNYFIIRNARMPTPDVMPFDGAHLTEAHLRVDQEYSRRGLIAGFCASHYSVYFDVADHQIIARVYYNQQGEVLHCRAKQRFTGGEPSKEYVLSPSQTSCIVDIARVGVTSLRSIVDSMNNVLLKYYEERKSISARLDGLSEELSQDFSLPGAFEKYQENAECFFSINRRITAITGQEEHQNKHVEQFIGYMRRIREHAATFTQELEVASAASGEKKKEGKQGVKKRTTQATVLLSEVNAMQRDALLRDIEDLREQFTHLMARDLTRLTRESVLTGFQLNQEKYRLCGLLCILRSLPSSYGHFKPLLDTTEKLLAAIPSYKKLLRNLIHAGQVEDVRAVFEAEPSLKNLVESFILEFIEHFCDRSHTAALVPMYQLLFDNIPFFRLTIQCAFFLLPEDILLSSVGYATIFKNAVALKLFLKDSNINGVCFIKKNVHYSALQLIFQSCNNDSMDLLEVALDAQPKFSDFGSRLDIQPCGLQGLSPQERQLSKSILKQLSQPQKHSDDSPSEFLPYHPIWSLGKNSFAWSSCIKRVLSTPHCQLRDLLILLAYHTDNRACRTRIIYPALNNVICTAQNDNILHIITSQLCVKNLNHLAYIFYFNEQDSKATQDKEDFIYSIGLIIDAIFAQVRACDNFDATRNMLYDQLSDLAKNDQCSPDLKRIMFTAQMYLFGFNQQALTKENTLRLIYAINLRTVSVEKSGKHRPDLIRSGLNMVKGLVDRSTYPELREHDQYVFSLKRLEKYDRIAATGTVSTGFFGRGFQRLTGSQSASASAAGDTHRPKDIKKSSRVGR